MDDYYVENQSSPTTHNPQNTFFLYKYTNNLRIIKVLLMKHEVKKTYVSNH